MNLIKIFEPVLRAVTAAASLAGPVSADIDRLLSWDFEDGPDSQRALDSSGTENDGRLGATESPDEDDPRWIEDGASGKALHFDGNDFLEVAMPCCLEPDALTLELRVRGSGPPSSSPRHLAIHRPRGCDGGTYALSTREIPEHPGRVLITFSIQTTEDPPSLSPWIECLAELWDGRWHHLAGTFHPKLFGGTAMLYVDGIIRAFAIHRGRIDYRAAEDPGFYVGGLGDTLLERCGPGFEGDIDEVRITGRALSPLEVFRRAKGVTAFKGGDHDGDLSGGFPFDTPVDISLGPGRSEYCFRFLPPAGKPLVLSLSGDDVAGPVSLFIRWGGPAKPDDFDQAAEGPVQEGLRLVVHSARDEVCHGLIKRTSDGPSAGTVTLTIRPVELVLEDLSASLAGSGAPRASSVIRGAGFDASTEFFLQPAGCDPGSCEAIPGTEVLVVTSLRAETAFVIEGAPIGLYDLIATKDGGLHTAVLPGAFEVKELLPDPLLEASLRAHRFYRKRDVGRITISYANRSDRERPAPLFLLRGPPGAELRLERDRDYQGREIQVLGIQPGGVPGILSPGAEGEQVLYYRLTGEDTEAVFRLLLLDPGAGDLLDWDAVELPAEVLPGELAKVRAGLSDRFGSTWLDYLANLGSLASRLSRRGTAAASVRDLFRFAVREAYGRPSSAILGRVTAPGTGIPLGGLRVVALELPGTAGVVASNALTDANGSYFLDWLEGGRTYEVGIVDWKTGAGPVAVPPGGDVYRFDLAAEPEPGNGLVPSCPNCDETGLPDRPLALPEGLLREVPGTSREVRVVGAKDPNEKEGSGGQGDIDLGFVSPGDAIQYVIHFENVGNAGVRDLVVIDDLDPGLDLSSIRLNDVRSSSQEPVPLDICLSDQESGYTCSPSQDSFVPVRFSSFPVLLQLEGTGESLDLSVDITGTVSGASGGIEDHRIQWVLEQTTALGPEYSQVGFLMPGETGYVSFTASPLATLAEGTEIQNQASISFDGEIMSTRAVRSTFSLFPRPQEPNSPSPPSGTGVPVSPDSRLRWEGDGATSWDVTLRWLEGAETKTLEVTGLTTKSLCPPGLLHDRTFEWQVVARNSRGISTSGPPWTFRTQSPVFRRADANADGVTDLSDAIFTIFVLFGGSVPACEKSLDFDGDGAIEVTDAVLHLSYLYLNGMEPSPPFTSCGTEPAGNGLTCREYGPCGVREPCR